jgi:glycosyltransferase involved in cell wall biosynthesis
MELIFVNDASTDGTLEKLLSFERTYPESVLVVNLEKNSKQGAARNIGLSYASGEYIGFVDSDDWVEITMFEKMIQALDTYHCDFVQCRYDFVGDGTEYMVSKPWPREWCADVTNLEQRREFMCERMSLVAVWDKVYRRDFLLDNEIFFIEGLRCEDIFYSHLVFVYAKSSYCTNDVLYHYFYNAEGTMRQENNPYQLDKMKVSEAFLELCMERGLMETRKEDVEWLFLKNYYIYMLWEIFHVFPERSYEFYQQMKINVKDWVPGYKNNPYRFLEGFEFENLMLKLLDLDLNEEKLQKVREDMLSKIMV